MALRPTLFGRIDPLVSFHLEFVVGDESPFRFIREQVYGHRFRLGVLFSSSHPDNTKQTNLNIEIRKARFKPVETRNTVKVLDLYGGEAE